MLLDFAAGAEIERDGSGDVTMGEAIARASHALTLRSELLDFVGCYPASCGSERDLGSFLGEINQMLNFVSILFLGPNAFSFFES